MSQIEDGNKALVRRIYTEMWNRGDPQAAKELFARPEGVQRFVQEFLEAFPDLQHTVETVIAEEDRAAVVFSAQGTHRGQWKQYPPSGKKIHYSGVTVVRIAAGKIVEHHTWWDTQEVIEQITS